MKSVSIEQLPQKMRKEVERFLKRNRDTAAARVRPRFGLSGVNWIALDNDGCMGIGSTPSIALKRFNHLCEDNKTKPTMNGRGNVVNHGQLLPGLPLLDDLRD